MKEVIQIEVDDSTAVSVINAFLELAKAAGLKATLQKYL